ncbi:hypothetical protein [Motilimonas eburnea]|uniref:hypothetical protein n=1 Tax=Motilimonas eburnea TaxID=1737488 RepID=UPI001E2F506A|nr:hypothetical protein [Motilimonas eburnea]MCE2571722.1 hypothetical protein [Motilimonas eburnea]
MDLSDVCWVVPSSLSKSPLTALHEQFSSRYPCVFIPVVDEGGWLSYGRAKFQLISFWNKAILSPSMHNCFRLNAAPIASQPDDEFYLSPLKDLFFPGNFAIAKSWHCPTPTFSVGVLITSPVEQWQSRALRLLSNKDSVQLYCLDYHRHHISPVVDARHWQTFDLPCTGDFASDVIALSFYCQAMIVVGFIEPELANFLTDQGITLRVIQ